VSVGFSCAWLLLFVAVVVVIRDKASAFCHTLYDASFPVQAIIIS